MSHMDVGSLFLSQSRSYLRREYRTKLRWAVAQLPSEALWWRANEQSNSVGNLVLHLTGNIRQWIVGGVGGESTDRDRAGEFAAQHGPNAEQLLASLDRALDDVDRVLERLGPADLVASRTIQGRETTVLEAIYHVVEHFSLHLGQIILVAKMHAPGSVRFYDDADGLARPLWPEVEPTAGANPP
jgi:uncharacterized damage-inducible protein DinB